MIVYSLQDVNSQDKPLRTLQQAQLGISYISAMLKKHGHSVKLLVLSSVFGQKNLTKLKKCVEFFKPRIALFTSVSTEYPFIASIASYVKKNYPDIFLVIGGVHATLNPEEVMRGDFDALCVGEGEYPVLELVRTLENKQRPSGIANLWIRSGNELEKNGTRAYMPNLDSLPFPDVDMWLEWTSEASYEFSVLLGRGCPFLCTYCCNHALKNIASGEYVRYRSPENVIKEIRWLAGRFPGIRQIYFEVETICANQQWAIELLGSIEKFNCELARPVEYGTNLRIIPGKDFEGLFRAFQKSNFKFINIGLESGSEKIRKEVLNRSYSNEDIVRNVKLAKKYGLKVCLFNLMGLPLETEKDFFETVSVNRECQPDWYFTSIFYPYPGTKLYKRCIEMGLIDGSLSAGMERSRPALKMDNFPKHRIQKHYEWFDYYVHKGYKPLVKILARVFVTKAKTNPYTNYLYRKVTNLKFFEKIRNILRR